MTSVARILLALALLLAPSVGFLQRSIPALRAQVPVYNLTPRSTKSSEVTTSFPTSPSATSRPSSSLPTRRKRGKSKKSRRRNVVQTITDDDLADHVSSLYIHGPQGVLRGNPTPSADDTILQKLERHPSLILNADYQPLSHLPLSLWSWQDAIKAIFSGKVTVVDVYPDVTIRAAHIEVPLPSVIALNEYVSAPHKTRPAFTKRNVFLRDEYRCQYCLDRFPTRDLSLDHVVPRSRGGVLCWQNAVTSCRVCNGRKGSLLLSELQGIGMELRRQPIVPSQYELAAIAGRLLPRRNLHPTWEPYLGISASDRKPGKETESWGEIEL